MSELTFASNSYFAQLHWEISKSMIARVDTVNNTFGDGVLCLKVYQIFTVW